MTVGATLLSALTGVNPSPVTWSDPQDKLPGYDRGQFIYLPSNATLGQVT